MNRSNRQTLAVEFILQPRRVRLGVGEHQGQSVLLLGPGFQLGQQLIQFVRLIGGGTRQQLLRNRLSSTANATHSNPDVVIQKILCHDLHLFGKSSRKHHCLAILCGRHSVALHDLADLRLETHVQHAIRLIQHKVLDVLDGQHLPVHEISQSPGSGNNDINPSRQFFQLSLCICASVDFGPSKIGPVHKFSRFDENLRAQLSGRCQDHGQRVAHATERLVQIPDCLGLIHRCKQGQQKRGSLPGSCLSADHHVTSQKCGRNRMLLDRGWLAVSTFCDVGLQESRKLQLLKKLTEM
mmetsp:Transcript_20413/g.49558  ORF Transcript_20413/g.49558 Transcript_20413/m.49558 type:complete len:296 (-) Transcript_20413:206-1093(-)